MVREGVFLMIHRLERVAVSESCGNRTKFIENLHKSNKSYVVNDKCRRQKSHTFNEIHRAVSLAMIYAENNRNY